MSDYRIPSIPDQWPISAEKGAYHHYFNKVMRQNTLNYTAEPPKCVRKITEKIFSLRLVLHPKYLIESLNTCLLPDRCPIRCVTLTRQCTLYTIQCTN